MLNFIRKVNAKYDQLPEPKRFFCFFIPCSIGIILAVTYPWIGWPYLFLLLGFRLVGKIRQ